MTKAELRFHFGGALCCPERYKTGELKGEMNYVRTINFLIRIMDEYIEANYVRRPKNGLDRVTPNIKEPPKT